MSLSVPKGFNRFRVGSAHVVAHESCASWARDAIGSTRTLYEWAAAHPERRELSGRVTAYSVPLPDVGRVVVRRSHHGGLLGSIRKDLFFPPTRAPYELLASYVLAASGVKTPPVVAIAVYPASTFLRRSDVVSLEMPGRDLGQALLENPDSGARDVWITAVAVLLRALTAAGAWHPDLNLRNVFLVPEREGSGSELAFVLDIDRITFVPAGDPQLTGANLDRLERSIRKWRSRHGAGFDDAELRRIRHLATNAVAS